MIVAARKQRGAEIPEKTRIPCAVFEGTARPIEMVLTHKGTYRKLFNAALNLCDKCNLMCSTMLKARVVALRSCGARRCWNSSAFHSLHVPVPRGGRSGVGSPAPCRRDLAATRGGRGAEMLEQRRVPYAACSSDATIGD